MKSLLSALALMGVLIAGPLVAAERTVKFSVPGMYCASCPFIVESAMSEVEGVISVKADLDTRTALVVYDDEIAKVEDIADASTFAGYEATILGENS